MSDAYEVCAAAIGFEDPESAGFDDTGAVVSCVAKQFAEGLDAFFLIYSASLVFFMQAGFAMLCAGAVQRKNVQNTMLKNLLDACGAALGFFSFGYAFSFGGTAEAGDLTFIGNSNFFLRGDVDYTFWIFQYAFAATSVTIVAGTLAERCQMTAYVCYSVMLSGFVYPVIVHSVWSDNGFLSVNASKPLFGVGVVDFAGSGVVHMTGGITSIIAAKILGSRKGRFFDERGKKLAKPKTFPGHSVALQVLGTFILWFGWYGFNIGSAASISSSRNAEIGSLAGVNTTLSAAAGGVAALFANLIAVERRTGEAEFNLTYAMNGCLAGLVAITAGCAIMEPWAALIVGIVAGLLYLWFSGVLVKYCIDDAVDAIPVHMVNGVWGLLSTGLFASPDRMMNTFGNPNGGWFYEWGRGSGNFRLMGAQIVGVLAICAWVIALMLPFFGILNYLGWFRADALEEIVGLDVSYHGGSYTDSKHDNALKKEYLDMFRKRQEEHRREEMIKREKKRSPTHRGGSVTGSRTSGHSARSRAGGSFHDIPDSVGVPSSPKAVDAADPDPDRP